MFRTRPLDIGLAVADACYRTIRRDALGALEDTKRHRLTAKFESLVEAVILMSGVGFENGGLSIAHALTRGLQNTRDTCDKPHGFQVAYGLLVQLALEDNNPDYADVKQFLRRIGLPTSRRDLGLKHPQLPDLERMVEFTMGAPHIANFPIELSSAQILHAIQRVEEPGG